MYILGSYFQCDPAHDYLIQQIYTKFNVRATPSLCCFSSCHRCPHVLCWSSTTVSVLSNALGTTFMALLSSNMIIYIQPPPAYNCFLYPTLPCFLALEHIFHSFSKLKNVDLGIYHIFHHYLWERIWKVWVGLGHIVGPLDRYFGPLVLCSKLGRKDHKHTPGLIIWLGSDEWTRTRRLSAMGELWLQPTKVVPLAPMSSWILECQNTKSCRTQRGR